MVREHWAVEDKGNGPDDERRAGLPTICAVQRRGLVGVSFRRVTDRPIQTRTEILHRRQHGGVRALLSQGLQLSNPQVRVPACLIVLLAAMIALDRLLFSLTAAPLQLRLCLRDLFLSQSSIPYYVFFVLVTCAEVALLSANRGMSVDGHRPMGLVPNGLPANGLVTKNDTPNVPSLTEGQLIQALAATALTTTAALSIKSLPNGYPTGPAKFTSPTANVQNLNASLHNGVQQAAQRAIYRSLDHNRKEFRILLLDDCANAGARQLADDMSTVPLSPAILKFKLKTVSLLDVQTPAYEAISYCWGNRRETSEIMINGTVTTIPASAESTLRAMCATHGHLSVWLDAVCINQADMNERGEQVDLMGDIYSRASRTLIWLGDALEPTLPMVSSLYEFLESNMPSEWRAPDTSSTQDQLLKHSPKQLSPTVAWPLIYSFFANRWFTRAWVIQEVALARHALCYQGLQVFGWENIAAVATWLYKRRYKLPKHPKKSALTGIENVAQIWLLGRHKKQKLASLLRLVYTFNCTEPVDMVYATLGMRHKAAQKPGSNSRIIPIYQEPLLEVYAKATKAAILETRSLGILKHAHSLRPLDENLKDAADFPSWALRLDRRRHYHINPISYRDFRFHANDYLPLIIWPNESPRVLRVQGVMYDIVTDVSPPMQWRLYGDVSDTLTAAAVLHETYAWICEACPTWNEYLLARKFALTVAAGQDAKGRNVRSAPEYGDRLCDGFINTAHAAETKSVKDDDSDAASDVSSRSVDVKDFDTDLTNGNPDAVYALSAMIKSGHHRTVFVTQSGSLGLGTDNVLPGDVVCVLFGGSVPFVLRPEAHYWRFVGDAFVEEIMEGQHIQNLKAQKRLEREKQWFKIR